MTLDQKALRDNKIMKIMKVSELCHTIAKTDKGDLTLKLVYGQKGTDYQFVLDAVPFGDDDNKQLIDLFEGVLYES